MVYKHSNLTPEERVELDNLRARDAQQRADIEYIAMMTDVELETEEETNNVE